MSIPTNYQASVKCDLYNAEFNTDCDKKKYIGSLEKSIQKAIEYLSGPSYNIKMDESFFELVDLKEVVVEGYSYQVTDGRCSGAVAIERIKKIVEDHFKII